MRRWKVAALLLLAGCAGKEAPAPSKPSPPPAGPVQRLADPDPAVSAAARKELMALDILAVPGLRADAERPENAAVRTALYDLAASVEARTLAVAQKWAIQATMLQLRLDDVEASTVAPGPVFFTWLSWPEKIATNPFPVTIQVESIHKLGLLWLRGFTLADFGRDADSWRRFLELHRCCSVTELRMEGLKQRGYDVTSPDANIAARSFIRAAKGQFGPSRSEWSWKLAVPDNLAYDSLARLFAAVFDPSSSKFELTPLDVEWLELNLGCFTWDGGRLVSRAGPDEILAVYRGDDEHLRLAALRELCHWPGKIPPDAWKLVDQGTSLVVRAMHLAGVPAPPKALPVVLTALGPTNDPAEISKIWNLGDLEVLALDSEADSAIRAQAIRVLASLDHEKGLAFCTSILKSPANRRLVSAAILNLSRLPGDDGVKAAETWLASAQDGPDRFDVAIELARRGSQSGFDIVLQRARGDRLDRRRAALVREFVVGAPEADQDDQWPSWAASTAEYTWDGEHHRWESAK